MEHSASYKLFWRSETVIRNRANKIEAAMDPQKASALCESFSKKDGHGINQWFNQRFHSLVQNGPP